MNGYFAFTKKEWLESIRTYKPLVILTVFLLFGMLNPITAKITPDLIATFIPGDMSMTIAAPSAADSWIQFYKNMTGIQMIVFVIVFSGVMANDISRGTLVNMFTKGLSRKTLVLSKFTAMASMWSLGYLLSFGVTFVYTAYLLPGELPNLFFAGFCMWFFGIAVIAVMLFAGVWLSNVYGGLLVTGGFFAMLMVANIVPQIQKYSPYKLASSNMMLLSGQATASDFTIPIILTAVLILALLWLSIAILNKKQI